MKSYWPIGLVTILTALTYAVWKYVLHATMNPTSILGLLAVLAGFVAAIFSTYSMILQAKTPDVWLMVEEKPLKKAQVSVIARDNLVLLDLHLVNKGSKTTEKAYMGIEAPVGISIETHAVRRQATKGMIFSVDPDLRVDSLYPNVAQGWINGPFWPGNVHNLGEHNQLRLTVPGTGCYDFSWEVITAERKRNGTIKLLVKEHLSEQGLENTPDATSTRSSSL